MAKQNQIDESKYTMSEVVLKNGCKVKVFSPIFSSQEEKNEAFEQLKQATAWFLREAYRQLQEKRLNNE